MNSTLKTANSRNGQKSVSTALNARRKRHVRQNQLGDKQRAIMTHYQRVLRKEQRLAAGVNRQREELISESLKRNRQRLKMSELDRARLEFERISEQRRRKKEDKMRQNEERKLALQAYKKKRTENYRKISQKTSKGQPVMKGRMELLLSKIKRDVNGACDT